MGPAFAITRIQPPRRPSGWIDRPRLQHRLRAAVQSQGVTLLCAAAGYGKTAALAELIHQLPAETALAWVAADDDEQLPSFLACLAAALRPLQLPWSVAPDALATLALADHGLREVAGVLVNALAAAAVPRGLIVLDDGHRMVDPRVFELLQMLAERMPPHWGLVLASRVDPPLPLARLRASGELAEFRQAELQFDADEVLALLRGSSAAAGAGADDAALAAHARALLERTGGWVAGLRLSLSAGNAPAAGRLTQRHLFDFLATEVLAGMPPRLREFLLTTSVLPELSAARCSELSGMADAANLLEEIDRRGLFTSPLAADEPTLRLHDLFREFLEDRLRREQPAQWAALLERSAAGEPDVARAVAALARAGAWLPALQALGRHAPVLLGSGAAGTLGQLLDLFPPAQYEALPDLWMLRGLAGWPGYDFDALAHCMQRAAAGYRAQGRDRDAALASAHLCAGLQHSGRFDEGTQLLAALGRQPLDPAALAFVRYGEACDAVVCGRAADVAPKRAAMLAALQQLDDPASWPLWQQCPPQLLMLGAPGSLAEARRHADAILQRAGEAPGALRAGARLLHGWLALLAGRHDEALHWLRRADDDNHQLGRPRLVETDIRLLHTLAHALLGDAERSHAASSALIDDVRRAASPSHRRVHEPSLLFVAARAAWVLGDADGLRRCGAEMAAARHRDEWPSARGAHAVVAAMQAALDGAFDAAAQVLEPVIGQVDCLALCGGASARALLAWVHLRRQQPDAAVALLRPLLQVPADDERAALVFVGEGALRELAGASWNGRLDDQERQRLAELLQRHWPQARAAGQPVVEVPRNVAAEMPPAASRAVEHLTPREREILAHIAAGLSNKLIARDLDLSVHTVKQHVASILGKLGVASRGQAAAHWHRAAAAG